MNIKQLRDRFITDFSGIYDVDELKVFFYMLTEKLLGLKRVDVALNLSKELSDLELLAFREAQKRIENQEPIQYIVGETEFYGLRYKVTPHVLIPRPETEELVDWILKDHMGKKNSYKILDIGTGSGCIAISLAKNLPNAVVSAIDISGSALKMAKENASLNQVKLQLEQKDVLKQCDLNEKYAVIVSNPPYVRELEKKEIKPNVLDNEPHQALFVTNENPLVFYEKIAQLAWQSLKSEGALYFEINQYLGADTENIIREIGFTSVELRKDLFGNDRMIKAVR